MIEQACCLSGVALDTAIHGRVVLVDGTDVPTGNRALAGRDNYSGKRRRQGLNVQIASDLNGLLLCVPDPVPGARHDRAAITLCGWEPLLDRTEWRADPASTSTSAVTPRKNPSRHNMMTTLAQSTDISPPPAQLSKDASPTGRTGKSLPPATADASQNPLNLIRAVTRLELYRLGW
ncbi:hypothetical protein E2R33_00915 [Rathayibacter toxicus]|nr:hypothetical protein E2R33_00915 [Rathayibacter toxicus]